MAVYFNQDLRIASICGVFLIILIRYLHLHKCLCVSPDSKSTMYQLNEPAFAVALRSNIAPKQVSVVFVGGLLMICQVLEE